MTHSPFDPPEQDAAGEPTHLVLSNADGAYSLWPVFRATPDGWTPVFGPAPYGQCTAHLQESPA
ncbi:MbtH family NRPS accessory protein [Streptomyces sp. NPDC087440]|uniref:MbtH family NRPS accessory protein n=1 Tax=Streptomyces sp. NPDC087440 TaxID=3365790 RepID=UPI0038062350